MMTSFTTVIPEAFDLQELLRDCGRTRTSSCNTTCQILLSGRLFRLDRLLRAITTRVGTLKVTDRYSDARAARSKPWLA